jgi:hypothetical protein
MEALIFFANYLLRWSEKRHIGVSLKAFTIAMNFVATISISHNMYPRCVIRQRITFSRRYASPDLWKIVNLNWVDGIEIGTTYNTEKLAEISED